MSTHPLRCATCERECVYERCAPFSQGVEEAYHVAWRCPNGHGSSVDICPVGPLVPARGLCLNCGTPYPSDAGDAQCGACGLSRLACPAALGLTDEPLEDPIASARAAFTQGLFRRGIAILNRALQEDMGLLEPWFWKSRFLNSIGYNRSAAEMLDGAFARFSNPTDRIQLFEEQSFLWAECDRGKEALSSAESAAQLGSNSVRTHYLRGRALGLLGRLEGARNEMDKVLTLDPNNADAQRAMNMINAALRPTRWWQFWR